MAEHIPQFEAFRKELLECAICLTVYKDPKILPCMHTFCLPCLETMANSESSTWGGVIVCPLCRESNELPEAGAKGFKNNFFIVRVLEMMRICDKDTKQAVVCDACCRAGEGEESSASAAADMFCMDCNEMLCATCYGAHSKLKQAAGHRLARIGDGCSDEMTQIMKHSVPFCEKHPHERCTLYCQSDSCREPICMMCALLAHRDHNYTDITEVAASLGQKLSVAMASVHDRECALAEGPQREVERYLTTLQDNYEQMQHNIDEQAKILHSIIEQQKNDLLSEIKEFHRSQSKSAQITLDEVRHRRSVMDSLLSFGRQLLDKGSCAEICRLSPGLLDKSQVIDLPRIVPPQYHGIVYSSSTNAMKWMQNTKLLGTTTSTSFPTLSCNEDWASGVQHCEHLRATLTDVRVVEHLDETCEDISSRSVLSASEINSQTPKVYTHKAAGSVDINAPIHGLCVLDDRLYVVTEKSNQIDIYDKRSLKKVAHFIKISELRDPVDMVSCSKSKRIFITDCQLQSLFTVEPSGKYRQVSVGKKCQCISVTPTGNVLLSCSDDRCLLEYSPDTNLLRTIAMPFCDPWHAVMLPDNSLVVSQRSAIGNAIDKFVYYDDKSEYSLAEEISSRRPFSHQTHLAVDGHDNVFLADCRNRRVSLIDGSFVGSRELISDHFAFDPSRLCYDQSLNMLYVGLCNGKSVHVYIIQPAR